MTITILSQSNCPACRLVERTIEQTGLTATVRDVREDPEAEALLRSIYDAYRPGRHPSTPVTLIDDHPSFGVDGRRALRDLAA
ncbi:glutaredoxin family protein [Gordonia otitidis]|uniref:glutaredoxin family protein n=1 Tax=Gordonia otitidis TaxID=249058 RepID=UPI00235348CD|nr:glutaredoxin domain-containing protein [Gordonia otitidis]